MSGSFPRHAGKRASQSAAVPFILLMVYQRSEIRYEQLAMARATSLKLVMCHFAPSPSSDALRCCAAAACGLRRALRAAVIRLCASCLFISRKEIFFTHQSIPDSGNGDKAFIGCSDGRSTCIWLDSIRTERAFLKSKRNGAGREWDETDDGEVERGFRNAR